MNVQQLPPKMAAQFAERAKRGEATEVITGCYIFRRANDRNEVCLISLEPPTGHISRVSHDQMVKMTAEGKWA